MENVPSVNARATVAVAQSSKNTVALADFIFLAPVKYHE